MVPKRRGSKSLKYAVGYGRPPKATQFKPGQSGNARGRPKGPRTIGAILREVIGQKIAVNEGSKTRRLPMLEVMLRRLANEAMRNDPKARKLLISLVERYSESPDPEAHLDELLADDQAILREFLEGAVPDAADRTGETNDGEPDDA
jgi:Family of unknown function (DUF5681)